MTTRHGWRRGEARWDGGEGKEGLMSSAIRRKWPSERSWNFELLLSIFWHSLSRYFSRLVPLFFISLPFYRLLRRIIFRKAGNGKTRSKCKRSNLPLSSTRLRLYNNQLQVPTYLFYETAGIQLENGPPTHVTSYFLVKGRHRFLNTRMMSWIILSLRYTRTQHTVIFYTFESPYRFILVPRTDYFQLIFTSTERKKN